MNREYDDEVLAQYFDVTVMDVIAALFAKAEIQYSTENRPEVDIQTTESWIRSAEMQADTWRPWSAPSSSDRPKSSTAKDPRPRRRTC